MSGKTLVILLIIIFFFVGCHKESDKKEMILGVDSLVTYYMNEVGNYYYANQLDSASLVNQKLIRFLKQQEPDRTQYALLGKALTNEGTFYSLADKKDSAIYYYQQSIAAYRQSTDHTNLPDVYINLADVYNLQGDFPQATSSYRKALMIADSLGVEDQYKYSIFNGLGRIYTDLRNYPQADYYFNLVEQDLDSIPLFDQYFFSNSRSTYFYDLKEYKKSLFWLKNALGIAATFNYPLYEATVEMNLGEVYLLLGEVDSAKQYTNKASDFFLSPQMMNPSTEYYAKGVQAAIYLHTGDLQAAERLLTAPYNLSLLTPTYVYYNDKRLEELYKKKGDYRKAYEYRKRADLYDDSLRNIRMQNNITEIDSRYRQDTTLLKRDVLIAHQKQEVSRLYTINVVFIASLVIVVLSFILIVLYIRRKREKRFSQQMAVITQLRMDNIRSRVSPHFMYNVLNAVLPPLRQHEELSRPLDLLVQSVRDSLLTSEKIAIPLSQEVNIVKNYILLRESIHALLAKVSWNIAPDVDMNVLIPSMIIQIPVENAVKYAFDSENSDHFISINIENDSQCIRIDIEDNGKGFNPVLYSETLKGTGNGLKIMYKTIELLNSKNQDKMLLEIKNLHNVSEDRKGTLVSIVIPLNYQYKV